MRLPRNFQFEKSGRLGLLSATDLLSYSVGYRCMLENRLGKRGARLRLHRRDVGAVDRAVHGHVFADVTRI